MKQDTEIEQPLLLFVAALVAFCARSITLKFLWNWFILPLGIVELSYAHSFGLVLIMAWLSNSKEKPTHNEFAVHIIKNILVLAIGFFIANVM